MASDYPVDIVDRYKARNLHGVTWHIYSDAMLDELSRVYAERDAALEHLLQAFEESPGLAGNKNLVLAALALL